MYDLRIISRKLLSLIKEISLLFGLLQDKKQINFQKMNRNVSNLPISASSCLSLSLYLS